MEEPHSIDQNTQDCIKLSTIIVYTYSEACVVLE